MVSCHFLAKLMIKKKPQFCCVCSGLLTVGRKNTPADAPSPVLKHCFSHSRRAGRLSETRVSSYLHLCAASDRYRVHEEQNKQTVQQHTDVSWGQQPVDLFFPLSECEALKRSRGFLGGSRASRSSVVHQLSQQQLQALQPGPKRDTQTERQT